MYLLSATFLMFTLCGAVLSRVFREDPAKRSTALAWLTGCFWLFVDLRSAAVLVVVAFWVHVISSMIADSKEAPQRRFLQRVGVCVVVVVLLGWRVVPALVDAAGRVGVLHIWIDSWWQPIGVAIMAIQAVSVIVDVARRDTETPSFAESLLICGFFPKAAAGPLVRCMPFLEQIRSRWDGNIPIEKVAVLICAGAFKRYVLSESIGHYVDLTTRSWGEAGRVDMLLQLLCTAVRPVVDIAAYTDIAIAAGLCCGVVLPSNFRAPFSAWSVGELFRRWHTSVSGFFRDYVLPPLRGNSRSSEVRLFFAVVGTFLLVGAWHSLSWATILWGGMLGLPVAVETVRNRRRSQKGVRRKLPPVGAKRWAMALITFSYFALVSVLAGAGTLSHHAQSVRDVYNAGWFDNRVATWYTAGCVLLSWAVGAGLFARVGVAVEGVFSRVPGVVLGIVVAVIVTIAAGFVGNGIPHFLYESL
jgi:alginate O-acetyltransferase complex protein AlgI